MRSVFKALGILLLLLVSPVVYWLVAYIFLLIIGFHPDATGHTLAEELIQSGKDVGECNQIYHPLPHPFSPSAAEQRSNCIYRFAKLAKDPTACEFLLPGEYGLSCLSTVGGILFSDSHCSDTWGKNEVGCTEYSNEGYVLIENPQLRECILYLRQDIRDWCHKTRTRKFKNIHECDLVVNVVEKDACETGYAFKLKSPSLCSAVKDKKRRQYCEIRVNTWIQYPHLQGSFYFGEQVPVDEEPASVP